MKRRPAVCVSPSGRGLGKINNKFGVKLYKIKFYEVLYE